MPDIPAPVNPAVQIADTIIHAVEYEFAVKAVKILARKYIPFLNIPVWGKIFDIIVNYVADKIYPGMSQFVSFRIIDIQTAQEKSAYEKTKEELRKTILTGDKDAIAKSKAEFEAAFANGIHFHGV